MKKYLLATIIIVLLTLLTAVMIVLMDSQADVSAGDALSIADEYMEENYSYVDLAIAQRQVVDQADKSLWTVTYRHDMGSLDQFITVKIDQGTGVIKSVTLANCCTLFYF